MYFFIFIKFFKKKFLIYIFIVNSCEHKNHDSCTFNSILVSLNVYHKEIYGVSLAVLFFLFFFIFSVGQYYGNDLPGLHNIWWNWTAWATERTKVNSRIFHRLCMNNS